MATAIDPNKSQNISQAQRLVNDDSNIDTQPTAVTAQPSMASMISSFQLPTITTSNTAYQQKKQHYQETKGFSINHDPDLSFSRLPGHRQPCIEVVIASTTPTTITAIPSSTAAKVSLDYGVSPKTLYYQYAAAASQFYQTTAAELQSNQPSVSSSSSLNINENHSGDDNGLGSSTNNSSGFMLSAGHSSTDDLQVDADGMPLDLATSTVFAGAMSLLTLAHNARAQAEAASLPSSTNSSSSALNQNINTRNKQKGGMVGDLSVAVPKKRSCNSSSKNINESGSYHSLDMKPRFSCDFCGKVYPSRAHLIRHTRLHTNERPFKCNNAGCEKTFSRRDNANHHERIHCPYRI